MNNLIIILWISNLLLLALSTWALSKYFSQLDEIKELLCELGKEVRGLEGWVNVRTSNIHVGYNLETTEKGDYKSEK